MIVNKISSRLLWRGAIRMKFSGGDHHHAYDWRDDHVANPDYVENTRMIGVKSSETYSFPYKTDHPATFVLSHPEDYNQKDLTTNMTGCLHFGSITNNLEVAGTNYMNDIAHEYDYESEDLDYQAESFETQHFRKKGPLWMWLIVGTCPLWFFANELFLQYWGQEDNFKYQRPPPLNYPNDSDTPDDKLLAMFKSVPHMNLYDAGVVNAPFFEVIDGKKVYTKWSGVNQPREAP